MDQYDKLIEIINSEENLEEFLTNETEYDYLYNLSHIRQNVIDWYDFEWDSSLLEIGAECGAITGLFCKRVKSVTALEKDERKCEVNRARNGELYNLKIVCTDTAEESDDQEKYDYITLIGEVTKDKLETARRYTKKGTRLIIATDNKYGLKNWSSEGFPETYSMDELKAELAAMGFKLKETYYPLPDYRFPLEIYSEECLPDKGIMNGNTPSYDREKVYMFDVTKTLDELSKDGQLKKFVNSFIWICEYNNRKRPKKKEAIDIK